MHFTNYISSFFVSSFLIALVFITFLLLIKVKFVFCSVLLQKGKGALRHLLKVIFKKKKKSQENDLARLQQNTSNSLR